MNRHYEEPDDIFNVSRDYMLDGQCGFQNETTARMISPSKRHNGIVSIGNILIRKYLFKIFKRYLKNLLIRFPKLKWSY